MYHNRKTTEMLNELKATFHIFHKSYELQFYSVLKPFTHTHIARESIA